MRKEIRALHERLHATFVYVTHDQIEAMTMADHVVVMRDGVIEQQGRPLDLYDTPANRFVAGFIGSPAMNFIPATVAEDGQSLILNLGASDQRVATGRSLPAGKHVIAGLRPEHLLVTTTGDATFKVPVAFVESTGSATYVTTETQPELTVVETGRGAISSGDTIGLWIAPDKIHVFDRESDLRIS
jgi:multiple sugar transport system ATP-binding protein